MSDFLHALRDQLGLTKTAWLLTAGKLDEGHGTFNPDGANHKDIFGVDHSETPGAPDRNYVSQHGTGDNVNLFDDGGSVFLGPQILGVSGSGDQQADLDATSFVDGAAAALLALGRQKGIVKPLAPATEGHGAAKPKGQGVAKPVISHDPAQPKLDNAVSELKRILARAEEVQLPPGDHGGAPAVGLRTTISALRELLDSLG